MLAPSLLLPLALSTWRRGSPDATLRAKHMASGWWSVTTAPLCSLHIRFVTSEKPTLFVSAPASTTFSSSAPEALPTIELPKELKGVCAGRQSAMLRVLVALRKTFVSFTFFFFLHILGDYFVPNNKAAHKKKMGAMQGVCVFCLRAADRSASGQKLGELHPHPTSDESSTV